MILNIFKKRPHQSNKSAIIYRPVFLNAKSQVEHFRNSKKEIISFKSKDMLMTFINSKKTTNLKIGFTETTSKADLYWLKKIIKK